MLVSSGLLAERNVSSMHLMMIEETIRAREEEVSNIADNNRLVALVLGDQPNQVTRIRSALKALFARLDEKRHNWRMMHPQKENMKQQMGGTHADLHGSPRHS